LKRGHVIQRECGDNAAVINNAAACAASAYRKIHLIITVSERPWGDRNPEEVHPFGQVVYWIGSHIVTVRNQDGGPIPFRYLEAAIQTRHSPVNLIDKLNDYRLVAAKALRRRLLLVHQPGSA